MTHVELAHGLGHWQQTILLHMLATQYVEDGRIWTFEAIIVTPKAPTHTRQRKQRFRSIFSMYELGLIEEHDWFTTHGKKRRAFRLTEKGERYANSLHSPTRWSRGPAKDAEPPAVERHEQTAITFGDDPPGDS